VCGQTLCIGAEVVADMMQLLFDAEFGHFTEKKFKPLKLLQIQKIMIFCDLFSKNNLS